MPAKNMYFISFWLAQLNLLLAKPFAQVSFPYTSQISLFALFLAGYGGHN
jgi:hypothetical protein